MGILCDWLEVHIGLSLVGLKLETGTKIGDAPWPLWLSWLECCPMQQKVVGSIPGEGTYLGCGFDPQSGCGQRQPIDVSLSH